MIARLHLQGFSSATIPRTLSSCSRQCQKNLFSRIPQSQQSLLPQCRNYSTPTPPSSEPPRPINLRSQIASERLNEAAFNPRPSPKPKRSFRPYIYATIFLFIGLTAGQYVRLVIVPPPLPLPGTKDDELMIKYLQKEAERIPLVKSLTEDPSWTHYEAYGGIPIDERQHRLTSGPLGGARALGGFQRIFTHVDTGEVVSVVWFGGAIAGWPGVTHGGVTATVLDESLGRAAIQQFPSKTGVTANLELNYLRPVVTNNFYVIRAMPQKEGSTDYKQFVSGRLETLDGKVCVEAKGLFVVPKKYKTKSFSGVQI